MGRLRDLPEPRAVAGLVLLVVSAAPMIEGLVLVSFPDIVIACVLAAAGMWLHRPVTNLPGAAASPFPHSLRQRWLRFIAIAIPIGVLAYALGYVAFMDRQCPTHPDGLLKRFPTSFRWAPRAWVKKASITYATPWRETTIWNVIYDPVDRLWFRVFPRTRAEEDRLRALGYYR